MEIPAGIFKAKCLKLMEEVALYGEPLVITKYGKPIAKLVPYVEEKPKGSFGLLKGSVTIKGDIIGPTGEEWNAEKSLL